MKHVHRKLKRSDFKSSLELKFWEELVAKFRCPITYETEKLSYVLERKYIPDFIIHRDNGSKTYIEVKGYLRPADRAKLIAVKKNNPGLDLRLLFAQNNKVYGTKMRYSDWAKKYGFQFAFGKIPRKWITK